MTSPVWSTVDARLAAAALPPHRPTSGSCFYCRTAVFEGQRFKWRFERGKLAGILHESCDPDNVSIRQRRSRAGYAMGGGQ